MRVIVISIKGFDVLEYKNVTNISWNNNTATLSWSGGSRSVSTLDYMLQIIP